MATKHRPDATQDLMSNARNSKSPRELVDVIKQSIRLRCGSDRSELMVEAIGNPVSNSNIFIAAVNEASRLDSRYGADGSSVLIAVAIKTTDSAVLSRVVREAIYLGSNNSGYIRQVLMGVLENPARTLKVLTDVASAVPCMHWSEDQEIVARKVLGLRTGIINPQPQDAAAFELQMPKLERAFKHVASRPSWQEEIDIIRDPSIPFPDKSWLVHSHNPHVLKEMASNPRVLAWDREEAKRNLRKY